MRILALAAVTALTLSVSAAADHSIDYFRAIASSEALTEILADKDYEGYDIKSIQKTKSFRCPGCFQFDIKLERFNPSDDSHSKKSLSLMTSLDLATKVISVSAEH